jgi:AraC family transcriptional regulator, transcriptional activator of pobA
MLRRSSVTMDQAVRRDGVPRFFLYGEPPREVAEGFLHVETIAERSRLYEWRIRPHAHRDLEQLLLVLGGRGEMLADGLVRPFAAPALLIVPASVVHAFEFEPETRGYVASVAAAMPRSLARRDFAFQRVFAAPAVIDLAVAGTEALELEQSLALLRRELVWDAPLGSIAAEARLTSLLVEVARVLMHHGVAAPPRRGPRATLVGRFRDLLDARFREAWPLARYARRLGVSAARLRAACIDVTGKPPLRLVHARLLLEAQRTLAYTDLTVAETAYALGFTDPGYFSRFFRARTGQTPAAFRRRRATQRRARAAGGGAGS